MIRLVVFLIAMAIGVVMAYLVFLREWSWGTVTTAKRGIFTSLAVVAYSLLGYFLFTIK
jgi:hypothetical protein